MTASSSAPESTQAISLKDAGAMLLRLFALVPFEVDAHEPRSSQPAYRDIHDSGDLTLRLKS